MLITPLTRLLAIDHPILQAGMGGGAGPDLAAAVSNAGGLGTLASIGMKPDAIQEAIDRTRSLTSRPFAVNLVTWEFTSDWEDIIDAVIAAHPPALVVSFGDPVPALLRGKAAGITVIVQVQDTQGLKRVLEQQPGAVIAQGNEAGGHTGSRGTLSFVAQALDLAGDIPVVAAGGIADGRGLAATLAMGGAGAVMGTRFKATYEFAGKPVHKQAIRESDGSDTFYDPIVDIVRGRRWPNGVTGRVIRNSFTAGWEGRTAQLEAAISAEGPRSFMQAHMSTPEQQLNWAGEASGLIHDLLPAAEVVSRTIDEAERLLRHAGSIVGS